MFASHYLDVFYFTAHVLSIQEIHAPALSIWGVKIVVISIFIGFTLASIVSYPSLVRLSVLLTMLVICDVDFL